ncbi:DoxX family protein [candidate division KSB1 bacterium]
MSIFTTIVARVLYALPIFVFGLNHFLKMGDMAAVVPPFFPFPSFWVALTGLGLIAAATAIVTGKIAKLASLLLGAMLIVFVLTIHIPGLGSSDAMMAQMAMAGMLKDIALAGAAFFMAGIFNKEGSN